MQGLIDIFSKMIPIPKVREIISAIYLFLTVYTLCSAVMTSSQFVKISHTVTESCTSFFWYILNAIHRTQIMNVTPYTFCSMLPPGKSRQCSWLSQQLVAIGWIRLAGPWTPSGDFQVPQVLAWSLRHPVSTPHSCIKDSTAQSQLSHSRKNRAIPQGYGTDVKDRPHPFYINCPTSAKAGVAVSTARRLAIKSSLWIPWGSFGGWNRVRDWKLCL